MVQFLVTEFAEVGENEYLDPKAGKVHTVNHMEKVCDLVLRPAAAAGVVPTGAASERAWPL